MKGEMGRLMDEKNVRPDKIVAGLLEAAQHIVDPKDNSLLQGFYA